MRRDGASSNKDDWTDHCAAAALNSLGALAVVPDGELVRDPALRRLLRAVADEAASTGLRVTGAPARIAADRCRRHPHHRQLWQRALRQGRKTGAEAVLGPILQAARRAGKPVPKLAIIAEALRRLDKKR